MGNRSPLNLTSWINLIKTYLEECVMDCQDVLILTYPKNVFANENERIQSKEKGLDISVKILGLSREGASNVLGVLNPYLIFSKYRDMVSNSRRFESYSNHDKKDYLFLCELS